MPFSGDSKLLKRYLHACKKEALACEAAYNRLKPGPDWGGLRYKRTRSSRRGKGAATRRHGETQKKHCLVDRINRVNGV